MLPPSFLYTSFVSSSDHHSVGKPPRITRKDLFPSNSDPAPLRLLSPSPSPPVALKCRPSQLFDASHLDSGSALPSATEMAPADDIQHVGVKRMNIGRGNHVRMNALHHSLPPDSCLFAPDPSVSRPMSPDEKVQMGVPLLSSESPIASKFRASGPMPYFLRKLYPTGLVKWIDDLKDYPTTWLVLYFALNLSLTLYNKSVLIHFPFPYTLTAMHALCGAIGTFIWVRWESANTSLSASATIVSRPLTSTPHLSHQVGIAGWPSLSYRQIVVLILFSFLYTINIVVSNASLRLVTVPFHQVVRASTPFFTIIFSAVLLGKPCSQKKMLSLVPVVAGVGFATYGDYYFTAFGFMLTLLGTVLAAMKTIITNVILIKPSRSQSISLPSIHSPLYPTPVSPSADLKQNLLSNPHYRQTPETNPPASSFLVEFLTPLPTLINNIFAPSPASSPKRSPASFQNDLKPTALSDTLSSGPGFFTLPKLTLSPLHLLLLLSPLAFVETMILAQLTGELDRVRGFLLESSQATNSQRTWLLLNGVLAFFLNVVSFNANRRLGPLAMTVAANVKQVLTVLCAVIIFNLTITPANGVGIALTLLGGGLYAAVELKEKKETRRRRRA